MSLHHSLITSSQFVLHLTTMQSSTLLPLLLIASLSRGGAGASPHTPELTLTDNPGLHAFTYHGSFADDISFGKLILQINTKTMVRTVKKAADTMNRKLRSPSPFLKLMGRRIMESVNPATQRLETLDAILYQAKHPSGTSSAWQQWQRLVTPSTISGNSEAISDSSPTSSMQSKHLSVRRSERWRTSTWRQPIPRGRWSLYSRMSRTWNS